MAVRQFCLCPDFLPPCGRTMFFYGGPGLRWDEGGLTHFRLDPDPQAQTVDTLARSDPEVQTRCPDEQFPGSISLGVEPCGSTPDRKRSDSTGHPGRLHHQNYPGSDKPPSRCTCNPSRIVMASHRCLPRYQVIGKLVALRAIHTCTRHVAAHRLCRVCQRERND